MRVPVLAAPLVLALALAGEALAAAPAWHDVSGGLPPAAKLKAIAHHKGVVIAVGEADGRAAIYRSLASGWSAEPIDGLPAGSSSLKQVAVTGQAAWAVGEAAGKPLAVRFASGSEALAATGGRWQALSVPVSSDLASLTAVALLGREGFVGDEHGRLYRIEDGDAEPFTGPVGPPEVPNLPTEVSSLPAAGPIADLSYPKDDWAFAVAAWQNEALTKNDNELGTSARIFKLAAPKVASGLAFTAEAAAPDTEMSDLVAVASTESGRAIAIDGGAAPAGAAGTAVTAAPTAGKSQPGWWENDIGGAVWTRRTDARLFPTTMGAPARTLLLDVAVLALPDGGGTVQAMAGALDGLGTVWLRDGLTWRRDERLSPTPLRSIALAGPNDYWAVGDAGTALRYFAAPDPPPLPEPPAPGPGPGEPSAGPGQEAPAVSDPSARRSPAGEVPAKPVRDKRGSSGKRVEVDERGDPKRGGSRRAPGRLLRGVRYRRLRGRLLISFRLTGAARVSVIARRGGRVVARSRLRNFEKGRRAVVLRYRGRRAPTQLKIVVRPRA